MELQLSQEDEAFRDEVRTWLAEHVQGEFAGLTGKGGPGSEEIPFDVEVAWERELAQGGWIGLAWPKEFGGRGASLTQQVVFHMEYAASPAKTRLPNMGETLLGPTLITFGSKALQDRFLPRILTVEELWCQGYSEPDAGSDLANVQTRAVLDGGEWVVTGQKVWTSYGQHADWCFVVCRTDPDAPTRHRGISYLLVPMRQDTIEIRPLVQMSGGAEFNEVFFNGARTDAANIVGEVNGGWRVAMGTLDFERGASTLGQQIGFARKYASVAELAQRNGAAADPVVRQELARSFIGLEIMRFNNLRVLSQTDAVGQAGPASSIGKLYWSQWHRHLSELSMHVAGVAAQVAPAGAHLDALTTQFLYDRAHTIYAGSSEIQRNVLGEGVLGLPREPR
jgi:alkylation response protein AidB-like acyl-CoA dehydrogenase